MVNRWYTTRLNEHGVNYKMNMKIWYIKPYFLKPSHNIIIVKLCKKVMNDLFYDLKVITIKHFSSGCEANTVISSSIHSYSNDDACRLILQLNEVSNPMIFLKAIIQIMFTKHDYNKVKTAQTCSGLIMRKYGNIL